MNAEQWWATMTPEERESARRKCSYAWPLSYGKIAERFVPEAPTPPVDDDKPRVGDLVRVTYRRDDLTTTYEGRVTEIEGEGFFRVGLLPFPFLNPGHRTVEILERAQLPWQTGDMAYTHAGMVRFFREDTWYDAHGARQGPEGQAEAHAVGFQYTPIIRGGQIVVQP